MTNHTSPTDLSHPGSFDSRYWYKIHPASRPFMTLDVINDGNQLTDAHIHLAQDGNFSGQYWQFRPSRTQPGAYNLVTMWLGKDRALDVYGDDKTTPHLTAAGNFSGQQWMIHSNGDGHGHGTWRLTNSYSGELVLASDESGDGVHLRDVRGSDASKWILSLEKQITEDGFGL